MTYGYTYNQELNTFTAPPTPDTLPPNIVPPGSPEPDLTPVPGITE